MPEGSRSLHVLIRVSVLQRRKTVMAIGERTLHLILRCDNSALSGPASLVGDAFHIFDVSFVPRAGLVFCELLSASTAIGACDALSGVSGENRKTEKCVIC